MEGQEVVLGCAHTTSCAKTDQEVVWACAPYHFLTIRTTFSSFLAKNCVTAKSGFELTKPLRT